MLDLDRFYKRSPVLFHMAYAGAWPSILERGLLSAKALLHISETTSETRAAIRLQRRRHPYLLTHSSLGQIVLRDQGGMPEKGLTNALIGSGMTNDQWRDLLDERIFFWADTDRLSRLRMGSTYRVAAQTILEIDTRKLFEAHGDRIEVAEFNTGYARRRPITRHRSSFQSIKDYVPTSRGVVEVTLPDRLNDVTRFVRRVTHQDVNQQSSVLFDSGDADHL